MATGDALIDTLEKLRQSGFVHPLAATTVNRSMILREAAHWLWNAGLENDVFHRAYMQAMQTGRTFPTMRLWGSVEDKLVIAISGQSYSPTPTTTWTNACTDISTGLQTG